MDSYKDVFYSAGLPALISTGITIVYFILKAYQFAVHAVSHQTEGRLAAATPSGRKQEHGSIEGEQGHTEVPEQVPRSIADQYGAGIQQPSRSFSLSGGRQNVCLVAHRNVEEYPVKPSVPENAKRLPSRRNRSTENGDGQRPSGAYGDSSGVLAEGSGWPDAANEQSRNVRGISSQERSDQNTPDGIPGRRDPEKQVSDVSLQTDTCDTLYVTKNTLTAYTIAIVQNAQALQYDQMHAALQTGRNQSSLETPLRAEELLTAHFNLAVLEDKTLTDTTPVPKTLQITRRTQIHQPQHQTTRLTSRYRVVTLKIVLQGGHTPQEQLPQPADVTTDLSMRYLQVMSLMILGTICLIITTIHTRTT